MRPSTSTSPWSISVATIASSITTAQLVHPWAGVSVRIDGQPAEPAWRTTRRHELAAVADEGGHLGAGEPDLHGCPGALFVGVLQVRVDLGVGQLFEHDHD